MAEEVVAEDEVGHGFYDGDGTGEDAGVVTATAFEFGVFFVFGDGGLGRHDGGGGLEGDAEEDGFAIGDTALNSAGVVGFGADFVAFHVEVVVVLGAFEGGAGESRADFETFGGWDGEHGFGEVGFEAVEDGFTEPRRAATDDALDRASDGVSFGADFFDAFDHFFGRDGVASADDVGFDVGGGDGEGIDVGGNVLDGFDPSEGFEVGTEVGEDFFGDGRSGNAADGFARGGAATTGGIAGAKFGVVGVVGVRRTVFYGHLVVGLGAVVFITNEDSDGRTEGFSFVGAGEDFAGVGFVARSGDFRLARAAAVEFDLEVGLGEGDEGRAAIDDDTDAPAVGLTES